MASGGKEKGLLIWDDIHDDITRGSQISFRDDVE